MPSEPLLEVIDDLVPSELFAEACKVGAAKGWYFGHGSHAGDGGRFWKMDLEDIATFDAVWQNARERCEQMAGSPLQVLRQYANGHTYGLGGQAHLDDHRPGSFTLLYYPMAEWKDGWDGETVFYDEQGEIVLSVLPRPNRAILFDSRILHAGHAPSRLCPVLRVTVAYKLVVEKGDAVNSEPEASAPPPSPAPGPEETSRESAQREYKVRVASDRVRKLVEEHLSKLGETLRLPGFRPGKIPVAVLEKRYGDAARAEVVKRLAADAAASVPPQGSVVAAIDVAQQGDDLELRLTAIYLPDLPEPDLSQLTLERLTASERDLQSCGLEADALEDHLKQQMLDHLERSYAFALPGALVEREFAAIWQAAQSRGQTTDADAAEFRHIAERRVRLGIVVAELARRYEIAGPGMEDLVIRSLISQARVSERAATLDELLEMA